MSDIKARDRRDPLLPGRECDSGHPVPHGGAEGTRDIPSLEDMSRSPITRDFADHFADEWIAAWNAHDLPRVLSHYEEDFAMTSPLIVEIAGEPSGVLRGKKDVGAYWEKALALSPDLRFEKLGVFLGARGLAIHFRNQKGRQSVEIFEIGDRGLVTRSAAHHGA